MSTSSAVGPSATLNVHEVYPPNVCIRRHSPVRPYAPSIEHTLARVPKHGSRDSRIASQRPTSPTAIGSADSQPSHRCARPLLYRHCSYPRSNCLALIKGMKPTTELSKMCRTSCIRRATLPHSAGPLPISATPVHCRFLLCLTCCCYLYDTLLPTLSCGWQSRMRRGKRC